MSQRIELPSGGWVALKDPKHVTVRKRRPVLELMGRLAQMGESGDIQAMDDVLAVGGEALIAQWSFDEPPTAETIPDLLNVADAEPLLRALMPLLSDLVPNLTPDGAGDPASPTPG